MPNVKEITDLHQKGPDVYADLTEAQLRIRREADEGIFIAESPNVIERALTAGYEPISFLMQKKHITGDARSLLEQCPDVPVYTGDDALLTKLTGFTLTRGVLCAMQRKSLATVEAVCEGARRIAVLENITESTNVGAIFRSAAALNLDAVLVTPECCDPLCRRAVRVSMGNVFLIPWTKIGSVASDWPRSGMEQLHALGFKTAALALSDNSVSVADSKLASEEKLALILGTEGEGLLHETITASDYVVRIPMKEGVDSLNVAAAAAVAFWQLQK